jgi:ATP-binding cassette, subfamily B, multidrug efflux pump
MKSVTSRAAPTRWRSVVENLWPYVRPHAWRWVGSFAASAGSVACGLAVPRLLGRTIDELRAGTASMGRLAFLSALIVLAATASAVLLTTMRFLGPAAARRVAYTLRRDLFFRMTLLEPEFFHRTRTGNLLTALNSDVAAVQDMLGMGVVGCFNLGLTIVLTLISMLVLAPQVGLAPLAAFPVAFAVVAYLFARAIRRYEEGQEDQSTMTAQAQEDFAGIRVVKAYALEAQQAHSFSQAQEKYRTSMLRLARIEGMVVPVSGGVLNVTFAGVLLLGAYRLFEGRTGAFVGLTAGDFVAFVTYLFQLELPLLQLGFVANAVLRGAVSWSRVRRLMSEEPLIRDRPALGEKEEQITGGLRFEEVTLRLGDRTLLDRFSLDVPPGHVVGVTGPLGSGKTMMGAVAVRLYDCTSGRVLVGGRDVRDLRLSTLRRNIAIAPQEPVLFSETIAENIAFGLDVPSNVDGEPGIDLERVRWAAQIADLEEEVLRFPDGYATMVGERGMTLSGGQRQRVALARALVRGAPIFVFDDALSAVDAETESRVMGHLREVLRDKAVVLISHRTSALRFADEIVVIDGGRIVERGTHETLLARDGYYAGIERRERLARSDHA